MQILTVNLSGARSNQTLNPSNGLIVKSSVQVSVRKTSQPSLEIAQTMVPFLKHPAHG